MRAAVRMGALRFTYTATEFRRMLSMINQRCNCGQVTGGSKQMNPCTIDVIILYGLDAISLQGSEILQQRFKDALIIFDLFWPRYNAQLEHVICLISTDLINKLVKNG